MTVPAELQYTEEHEWIAESAAETKRIGITDYAQQQLGDVVFIDLPEVGRQLRAGDVFGEVESTKSVSELFAPVEGEVIAVNDQVADNPELVNADPYGEGWLVEIKVAKTAESPKLLDAAAYRELTGEH